MKTLPFTVHSSQFTVGYLFTVFHGQCIVNSKWPIVNSSEGAS